MNRPEEEGLGIEDLDALQSEVESMLVNVTKRSIAIESEVDALVNWQESQIKPKKGASSPMKAAGGGETACKRKQSRRDEAEEKTSKRTRTLDPGLKSQDSSSCSSSSSSSASCASTASSPVSTPAAKAAPAKDKFKSKSKNLTVSPQLLPRFPGD